MTGADFLITLPEFPDKKVSIKDFGAVENQTDIAGSKRNAAAINSAMSVISNEGGGTVVIPKGIWITGPIRLQSNVCLYLERGCKVFKKYRGVPADSDQLRGTGVYPYCFTGYGRPCRKYCNLR